MKTLFKHLARYWYFAVLASGFMVAEVFVDLLQPRLMQRIVDEGILGTDVSLVVSVGIKMILVVVCGGLCGLLSGVFTNVTGENLGNDLRRSCFNKIMHFSFAQTDRFSTGSLVTRITSDVGQVQQLSKQMIRGFVRCIMFFVGGTSALLSLNLSFGVILACAFPLILLDVIFVVWKTNPLFKLLQKALDNLNSIMQENVGGIRVVKAFVQEKTEIERFSRANDDLVNTQFRVQMLLSFLRPVMNIVLNLAVVGIIMIGSWGVQKGEMAPGAVMAAITYISQILNGMMMLAMIFQTLSRGTVSAKRLSEVLDSKSEIADGDFSDSVSVQKRGSVVFRNVGFSYTESGSPVLHDINLEIKPGETFAIIGSTGSGKTTLLNLVTRFYDCTEGSVEVDGIDVRRYEVKSLREKVSVCLQKSELFSSTIKENVGIGKPGATDREIMDACIAAQAHDFIMQQKDGYDTAVSEGGMSLSGGQRQRIAISRALVKKSDILIFDDSTSALDLRTEANLYAALDRNYSDVTKIIVAQRIASVRNADRIAVLDGGTVCACGSHDELMKISPVYRDIYESQLKSPDGGEK
ncbi:MAG: ABC transporter ATP-binding protein [Treponema sp.]|nr:ABC transporter ATP-binding protein [Treponema sp.]